MHNFFDLLDNQPLEPVDAAVVLRRKDNQADMDVRIGFANELIDCGWTDTVIMCHEANTLAEAIYTMKVVKEMKYSSIAIVTTKQHHYRAFLTFLKTMYSAGLDIKLICAATESIDGVSLDYELPRIEEYQQKGDIATYEEGITYLRREYNGTEHNATAASD